jgi:hypothetical protein
MGNIFEKIAFVIYIGITISIVILAALAANLP